MNEEWRPIRGFPGYQVSNLGRVRSYNKVTKNAKSPVRRWKNRIIKQKIDKANACRVCIWKDGKAYTFLVARLVADAFCGEMRDTRMTVNHIDGNRLNNNSSNLEWMSLQDNIRDGFASGLYGATQRMCTLINEKGDRIDFPSLSRAEKYLGRHHGYITGAVIRKLKITDAKGNRYTAIVAGYSSFTSPNSKRYGETKNYKEKEK